MLHSLSEADARTDVSCTGDATMTTLLIAANLHRAPGVSRRTSRYGYSRASATA